MDLGPDNIYRIRDPNPDPQGRVNDFILSHVAKKYMNWAEAKNYCEMIIGGGARVPSIEEYLALARAMTRNGRYNADALPDLRNRWFWSSVSPYAGFSFYFHGGLGGVDRDFQSNLGSVRCVVHPLPVGVVGVGIP